MGQKVRSYHPSCPNRTLYLVYSLLGCAIQLTPVFTQQQLSQSEVEDDLRLLERAWVKERGVADVLQWEGELVDSVLDKVEQQVSILWSVGARRMIRVSSAPLLFD